MGENQPNRSRTRSDAPFYIIKQENNDFLNLFKIVMGILAVPSVIFNLFFVAFGFEGFETSRMIIELLEILFCLEII